MSNCLVTCINNILADIIKTRNKQLIMLDFLQDFTRYVYPKYLLIIIFLINFYNVITHNTILDVVTTYVLNVILIDAIYDVVFDDININIALNIITISIVFTDFMIIVIRHVILNVTISNNIHNATIIVTIPFIIINTVIVVNFV